MSSKRRLNGVRDTYLPRPVRRAHGSVALQLRLDTLAKPIRAEGPLLLQVCISVSDTVFLWSANPLNQGQISLHKCL